MKSTEMLNQIKTLLNIEVKLEEMKLENGTVVTADSFEKGKEIFIVTDDEKVAMPVGEYILEDGRLVVVEEEGLISDLREVSDEVPEKETEEGEEITPDLEEEKEMADVGDWEGMEKRIQNLEDAIASLKGDKESKMEEEDEVEMEEEEVSRQPKSRTIKEEFSEEVSEEIPEEVKAELSEASAKPIKHNPEATSEKKSEKRQFAKGKFQTTASKVMDRINQINNK
tara:strand:- start:354 stop:1031 length:678 start_codon:yes stop_codon:yes gene_type:complete